MRAMDSIGLFFSMPIVSKAVTCPTDTCGSRNSALLDAMTMSASATKWSPLLAQIPLTAAITEFCHAAMPGGKTQLGTLRLARTGRECLRISSQLDDIKPGLEGVAVAGVHDHRDVVVSIEFGPRLLEVDKHLRVDGIRGIWTIEDQPACRAVVMDLDRHVGSSWRISNTLPSGSVSKAKAAPGLCGVTGVSTDAPASMACCIVAAASAT